MEPPRRRAKSALRVVVGVILVIWVISVVLVVRTGRADHAQRADAIVVLGAAQYVGRPSPVLRARLDHAILLWKRNLAPLFILTGGTGAGDTTSEAAVGRRYALRRGIPENAIVLESRGRTTTESMQAVAAIMDRRGKNELILVSDPFHMLRLSILARRYDMIPYTSPTRTSPISSSRRESWGYVFSESMKVPLAFFMDGGQSE